MDVPTNFTVSSFQENTKDYALENLEETNAVKQIPTGKVKDDQRTTKKIEVAEKNSVTQN